MNIANHVKHEVFINLLSVLGQVFLTHLLAPSFEEIVIPYN